MYETRETDSAWERLSDEQAAVVAMVDAERLDLERSRLPDRTAVLLEEPVYSVRSRLRMWERLVLLMEDDWGPDGRYDVDEYINDLESRDGLDAVLGSHPELDTTPLTDLLSHLDQRFLERTVPDGGAALRPYSRRLREGASLEERWFRRPVRVPWL